MATLIQLVSLSMRLHFCCLGSLTLLQVRLCFMFGRCVGTHKTSILCTNMSSICIRWLCFTLSTNLVPWFYCLFDFRNLGTKLEHFNGLQSDVHQMSKWESPQGCIWHVDQVAQTPTQVGLGASRSTRVWVGSARDLVDTSLCRFTRND
jgi:hypothetical protein